MAFIKETLTDTKSNLNFIGKPSELFQIKTELRLGNGLTPLLYFWGFGKRNAGMMKSMIFCLGVKQQTETRKTWES